MQTILNEATAYPRPKESRFVGRGVKGYPVFTRHLFPAKGIKKEVNNAENLIFILPYAR